MPDYKIAAVSSKPPRTWSFQDKKTGNSVPMETYKVMLEGDDEPVDLNRKPGNPPKVGELLSGTIEPTDFGRRFKPAPKQGSPFAGKDQTAIRAQWAIGQAVAIHTRVPSASQGSEFDDTMIEDTSKRLYAMVDRVRGTTPQPAQAVKEVFGGGEVIQLNNIPEDQSLFGSAPPEYL